MTKRVDSDLADLPLPVLATDQFLVARSNTIYRNDAAGMRGGSIGRAPINRPLLSDFPTWLNQSSATLVDAGDAISLQGTSTLAGTNIVGVERPIPSGDFWDVQVGLRKHWRQKEYIQGGIYVRDSASGKLDLFGFGHGNSDLGLLASRFASQNSFYADRRGSNEYADLLWFRLRQTSGAGFVASFSADGAVWIPFDVPYEGPLAFVPDVTHWGIASQMTARFEPNVPVRLDCFHWLEQINE